MSFRVHGRKAGRKCNDFFRGGAEFFLNSSMEFQEFSFQFSGKTVERAAGRRAGKSSRGGAETQGDFSHGGTANTAEGGWMIRWRNHWGTLIRAEGGGL
jgi:hypothetical protein